MQPGRRHVLHAEMSPFISDINLSHQSVNSRRAGFCAGGSTYGRDGQMFGAIQQIPHGGSRDQQAVTAVAA
jgi:hypothetical protein